MRAIEEHTPTLVETHLWGFLIPPYSHLVIQGPKLKGKHSPARICANTPVLGFLGHIMCLFVDGMCIYLCSLFFTIELFHTFVLRRKPVIKSLIYKAKITLIINISVIY